MAFGHEADRWGAPEEDTALGLDTDLEESPHEQEENFDNLVARYFGDVRQFALLNRAEEQVLWCRIESAQKRARRALYTSPVALPTLIQLWRQVEHGEVALDYVLRDAEALATRQADLRRQFEYAVLELQDIATRLQDLRPRSRRLPIDIRYGESTLPCGSSGVKPGKHSPYIRRSMTPCARLWRPSKQPSQTI